MPGMVVLGKGGLEVGSGIGPASQLQAWFSLQLVLMDPLSYPRSFCFIPTAPFNEAQRGEVSRP